MRGGGAPILTGVLMQAGMGGAMSMGYGTKRDWNKWSSNTIVGAASGFVSGATTGGLAATRPVRKICLNGSCTGKACLGGEFICGLSLNSRVAGAN
jgi:hypothetical protein